MTTATIDRFNGINGGLAVKAPCRVVTTANITLSGEQTINSVAVVAGDRVLVKDQITASENGIYDVSTSAWTRSPDFDGNRDVTRGTLVLVVGGLFYELTTANPITIGTTNLTFVISSASATDATLIALAALDTSAGLVTQTGTDTFTKRTLTGPAAGVSVTNGSGASGNPTIALANDLAAVEGLGTTGIAVRTGSDTWSTRTTVAPAAGITITNPAGVAGDITLALADDLAALEGMSGTGLVTRTATNTYTQRTITGTSNQITMTNGNGVSGNPTISLPSGVQFGTAHTFAGTANAILGGNNNNNSGTNNIIAGGENHIVTGNRNTVIGGTNNSASGQDSAVLAGTNNAATSTGTGNSIVGGYTNNITGNGEASAIVATISSDITASGSTNFIGAGYDVLISGGYCNAAFGEGGVISGGNTVGALLSGFYAKADKQAQQVHASGRFSVTGDAQVSRFVVRRQTTNATPAEMFLDGSSLRMNIPPDTTWAFEILLVARRTDADNESAAYQFFGCIDNNGGTTALVGAVQAFTPIEDTVAWAAAVTADNTNDALVITVTGEAAKTINWVARVETVEVTG